MTQIKRYDHISGGDEVLTFRISRMEQIYEEREGKPDAPHRHNYYTILFVLSAHGVHTVDFTEYPLTNNAVFFLAPGQVHQVVETQKSFGYAIVFSCDFLAQNGIPLRFIDDLNFFREYGASPPLALTADQTETLKQCCETMCTYYGSSYRLKEQGIGSLLKLFLIECNNFCSFPFDNGHSFESGYSLLKRFKDLAEQRYREWHSISEYADALQITADHLNRSVKSLLGMTAKDYLQSRLIIEAKRLLFFSHSTAKEIGYELGFSEPSNFSAFFKKQTSFTPSGFREKA